MTGARSARGPATALLALPLLFASAPAGAHGVGFGGEDTHRHFQVLLGSADATSLTVTEGQSETIPVGIRCYVPAGFTTYSSCSTGINSDSATNDRRYFDITATTPASAGGVTLSNDVRLSWNIPTMVPFRRTYGKHEVGTVTLMIDNNQNMDGDRTVTVSADRASGGQSFWRMDEEPTVAAATLTILDDDAPEVTLSLSPATIGESGTNNATTVTASVATAPASDVTVEVSAAPVSPAVAGDYTLSGTTTLTIAANTTSSTGTVTITAVYDSVASADKEVTVTGAVTGDGYNRSVSETLTIRNVDTAEVTVDEDVDGTMGTMVTEGDATAQTFMVALGSEPDGSSVTVAVSSDDADECEVSVDSGTTYSPTGSDRMLTFLPSGGTEDTSTRTTLWNNAQTVSVRSADDPDLDGDQTCRVRLDPDSPETGGDDAYRGLATTTVSVTVADNDVRLSVSPSSIAEDGGVATVTASMLSDAASQATLTVSAAPGVGADFAQTGTTLTIAQGARNSTGTVTITAEDDYKDAADKSVTVSATASSGFGAPADATLTIADDDTLELDVSKTEVATTEAAGAGRTDDFTVRLGTEPEATVTVAISSSDTSEATVSPASLRFGAAANPNPSDLITAGPVFKWDDPREVTVTGVDDDDPDGLQRYAITLDPSSAGDSDYDGLDDAEVPGTNADDDAPTVTLSVAAAGGRLAEGGSAAVTARLDRSIEVATTVEVSAAPGTGASASHFRLSENRTLTVAAGSTASAGTVTITAVDDDVDGPETRQVTVSGSASGGLGAADPAAVTLTIEDDDAAPRASLILTPAMIDESGPANAARVTAALSHPSSMATTVTVSAAAGTGASASHFRLSGNKTLTVAAGSTASMGTVTITAVDDEEQEPDREVAVSGQAVNMNDVKQPAAVTLTIRDDDGTEAVTAVLLPEAARAMADSRASAVRRRLESADAAGPSAPPALTALLAEHGPSLQEDESDWKKALAGSSFALPLNAAGGGSGGGLSVWGSGDYRDLDGEARGVSWDGDVVSAHLGLDRKLANGMRVGLAASWSEAKFDYGHRNREGEWNLEMASAQPYLGWTAGNGAELWASAGAGSGELEIVSGGTREESDADMWLAAAGARKPLHETESGLQVSLRGEALYSSFEVDGNGGRIQAYTADASRLRLALEARRERTLASGARLSPRFELGLRHDGGDGETGAGVELGGGAEYVSGRLTASGGARALAANSDYDEWGADLALAYAPGAGGRGFSFRLAPSWGATQSGTRKLWERGAPGLNGAADESDPGARLEAELGYGLKSPWSRGLLTLTLGGEAGEDAGAACRLKGAVALDATATLGLELVVRDPPSGGAERSLMATGELRF